jgi:hypothetical protein
MSETKLSFPFAISCYKFGHFIDSVSALSNCRFRLLRNDSGEIAFNGEFIPFKFKIMDGMKYLYDSFAYVPPKTDGARLELKNKLRGAVASYFLRQDNVFSIPLDKTVTDSEMSVLLGGLEDRIGAEVSLDGKTRMLMNNGKMDVGGSIRKKPHVLAFKCEYRGGKCSEVKICVPSADALGFYEEVHGFVEGYQPPQRL